MKTEQTSGVWLLTPKVRSLLVPGWGALILLMLAGCSSFPFPGDSEPNTAVGTPPAVAQQGGDYRIGPEDVLSISVWREDTLDRKVLVRPDGGISFPLAGDLQAAGKTVSELQVDITDRLRKYIPEPVVTVSLDAVSGYRVYVLGQVKKPGQFVVGRYVDVLQALTLAGGLTPYASSGDIKVVRRHNGREFTYPFDYSDVKGGRDLEQNIILEPDDVVVVP
jgi:polysaccharide export outer membrane protein